MEHSRNLSTVDERLDGALLRDLRDDLHYLTEKEGVILFAVDAFDVLRYCFPIGSSSSSIPSGDIERHADYFAALSFVMRQNNFKPILLPEYLAEVYGFSAGLIADYGKRHVGDKHLRQIVKREVEALIPDLPVASEASEVVQYMKANFPLVLLLAAAGAARIGLNELGNLVQRRLVSLGTLSENPSGASDVWSVLARFSRHYQPNSRFVNHCYSAFHRIYASESGEKSRRRNSPANDRADAVAIDQVLQMNQALRQAYYERKIDKPHTVRLLSSSARLRMLMDEISNESDIADPTYASNHIRIVRVPDQIFAFVIAHPSARSRTDEDSLHAEEVLETIKWLVELHERAESLRDDARSNVRTRIAMTEGLELLQAHRRRILAPYQNSYENLALFSRMREPLSQELDILARLRKGTETPPLVARLRELVGTEDLDSAAKEALNAQRHLVRVHTILAHRWCIGLPKGSSMDVSSTATDDFVHAAYQALPWLIHVSDPKLEIVVTKTREAFFSHPDDVQLRREALADAFEHLVKYDTSSDLESIESGEADLVRAVAFLALREKSSEKAAAGLARGLRNSGPFPSNLDALYLEIWAERRMSNFDAAIELASTGIDRATDDARFWHGRALARFGKIARAGGTPREYADVLCDFETALKLYRDHPAQPFNLQPAMVVGCLNALCYIHTLSSRVDIASSLRKRHLDDSRKYLNELKSLLNPTAWPPMYPEFFHTEGFLELQEAKLLAPAERIPKLENALQAAACAKRLAPTRPGHLDLYTEIAQELQSAKRRE